MYLMKHYSKKQILNKHLNLTSNYCSLDINIHLLQFSFSEILFEYYVFYMIL